MGKVTFTVMFLIVSVGKNWINMCADTSRGCSSSKVNNDWVFTFDEDIVYMLNNTNSGTTCDSISFEDCCIDFTSKSKKIFHNPTTEILKNNISAVTALVPGNQCHEDKWNYSTGLNSEDCFIIVKNKPGNDKSCVLQKLSDSASNCNSYQKVIALLLGKQCHLYDWNCNNGSTCPDLNYEDCFIIVKNKNNQRCVFHKIGDGVVNGYSEKIVAKNFGSCKIPDKVHVNFTIDFMNQFNEDMNDVNNTDLDKMMKSVKNLEKALERTNISKSESLPIGNLTAYLHQVDRRSGSLTLYANDTMAHTNSSLVLNSTVQVSLPEELVADSVNRTVVFCMITLPKHFESQNIMNHQLIGVSISEKNVSGLKSLVNISVYAKPPADKVPKCKFYNISGFEDTGCFTNWSANEHRVTCSCDHLTYFAILMVSPPNISEKDELVLTYISKVGCGLSLLFLVITVILYCVKWRASADHSQQVHVNLAVALILLNAHFLAVDLATNVPVACIYVAVLLHYSIMATFTWTAIEGFHLYLLLLRVFNIYIRKYLLKISLAGWGVPAVVVILIFIIQPNVYLNMGTFSENSTYTRASQCYISNDVVKNVTILGFFCVVFVFNLIMLVVVVRTLFFQRPVLPGQIRKHRAKNACTVLSITCLLGITWGLIFLSFGQIAIVGLYLFCIFNTLHGLAICIWFCISKSPSREREGSMATQTTS